jgi:GH35 family endo-1,4-beta-xylanase
MDRPTGKYTACERILPLLTALLLLASGCGVPAGDAPAAGFVSGDYAFVPRDRQVLVLDVRDPAWPQIVAAWDAPGRVQRVRIAGRAAYIVHWPSVDSWNTASGPPDGGVQIVDIGDPRHLRLLGSYRTPDVAVNVAVFSNVAYLAYVADWAGVSAVDVRRPAAPVEIVRLPSGMGGLQVADGRLAGVWGGCSVRGPCSGGFWLADLTDPRRPAELGRVVSPVLPGYDVAVVGRYAYIAGFGVWVVDLADPARPAVVSSLRLNGGVYHAEIEATETHLFVTADGLYVFDLAQAPKLVQTAHLKLEQESTLHVNVSADDMALRDGYLYLAANGGLYVVDVRDPLRPALIGSAAATPIAPPLPSPAVAAPTATRVPPPTDASFPTACDRFADPPSRLATAIHQPASPDPPLPATVSPRPLAYAAHTLYLDATVARLAADAGFDTAVQVFPWRDLNPEPGRYTWAAADDMARNAAAAGLNLVVRLDMPPDWARVVDSAALPFDLAAYADFVSAVAGRYRGRVLGYIIWNEPNLAAEWRRSGDGSASHWYSTAGGVAAPADYVGVLGVTFRRIRAADPAARVVTAGLAPTGERSARAQDDLSFLQAMLAAGAARCADVIGQHTYGYGQDPAAGRPMLAQPGLERVAAWRTILRSHGVDKPVWITELGYTVGPGSQPAVTPAQQAAYLAGAITRARVEWPWVEMLTVWNLVYGRDPGDEAAGFSLVEADAAPRSAYTRLQQTLVRYSITSQ